MTLLTFKSSSNSLDRFLKLIMWGWLRFFFFVMSIYTFVKYDLLAHTKLGPEKTSLIMLLSFAHRCHGGVASTASNPPSCRRDVWEVGRPAAAHAAAADAAAALSGILLLLFLHNHHFLDDAPAKSTWACIEFKRAILRILVIIPTELARREAQEPQD